MDRDWIIVSRVFAEAYQRHDAGEFGVREFKRGGVRWIVSVSPGHIEAKKIPPSPRDDEAMRKT